jgi:hypothetical protein
MYDYLDGHLDANQYKGYLRVMQSHKILRLTEQLFLWFLQDSTTNNNHGNTQKALSHGIRTAIANTLEAIKQENQSDLLYTIAEIFAQDPDRVVAADPDEYDDNSLFVRYGRLIYFRGDSVATYLSGKLDHELTVKSLSSQLSRAYLLESYGMELSGPLPKTLRKRLKLKNRERYYKLSVPALCELIIQAFPSPFERMASPLEEIRLSKGKG